MSDLFRRTSNCLISSDNTLQWVTVCVYRLLKWIHLQTLIWYMRNIFIHLSLLTLIRHNIHVFKVFGCSSPLFLQWKLNDKIMEYCTGSQPVVSFCNFYFFFKSLFFKIIWISEELSKTFKHCCPLFLFHCSSAERDPGEGGGRFLGEGSLSGRAGQLSL